jgi:predicted O-methyltransferase YrrM
MTHLTKSDIDKLIREFIPNKSTIVIDKKYLNKMDEDNPVDKQFLSFIEGLGEGEHYLTFLNYLIKKVRPKTIVELGNREGMSTLCIYDAIKKVGGNFYTVDIERDQRYCPDVMYQDKQVTFLWGDVSSIDILKKIPHEIDFLFSDTIHYNFQIQDEFAIYQHFLADTALVAIDDIHLNDKGVFFDEIVYDKWDLTNLCHSSGWGLFLFIRKEKVTSEEKYKRAMEAALHIWERKYNDELKKNTLHESRKIIPSIKKVLKRNKKIYEIYTKIYNERAYAKKIAQKNKGV